MMAKTKYIFVTGGVVSSLGKGIAAASLGALLESRGLSVSLIKVDPYINVDPGTMSPFQHGEVFVTNDGTETDLDLGHYERFVRYQASNKNNFTAGKVYETVIPRNVRLSEAPSHGIPVLVYDKLCSGSKSYSGFAEEFLKQENIMETAA